MICWTGHSTVISPTLTRTLTEGHCQLETEFSVTVTVNSIRVSGSSSQPVSRREQPERLGCERWSESSHQPECAEFYVGPGRADPAREGRPVPQAPPCLGTLRAIRRPARPRPHPSGLLHPCRRTRAGAPAGATGHTRAVSGRQLTHCVLSPSESRSQLRSIDFLVWLTTRKRRLRIRPRETKRP